MHSSSVPEPNDLPRILLMGPRRSGKTSIKQVVFNKMSPHETLFRLEGTIGLDKSGTVGGGGNGEGGLLGFEIWDFAGDYGRSNSSTSSSNQAYNYGSSGFGVQIMYSNENEYNSEEPRFTSFNDADNQASYGSENTEPQQQIHTDAEIFASSPLTCIVFVLDAQDEPYDHVLQKFADIVSRAYAANPQVLVEVFINKIDGDLFLSDESKYDCRRDIMSQVSEELSDTQSYSSALLENLPISYYLTSIYDHSIFEAFSKVVQKLIPALPTLEGLLNVLVQSCSMEKAFLFDVVSKLYVATDGLSPVDVSSYELCSDMIDVVLDVSGIYGVQGQGGGRGEENNSSGTSTGDSLIGVEISNADQAISGHRNDGSDNAGGAVSLSEGPHPSEYDSSSSSVIRLSNGMILYLKEVDFMLALVCLTKSGNFKKKSLVDYNIGVFKEGVKRLIEVSKMNVQKRCTEKVV